MCFYSLDRKSSLLSNVPSTRRNKIDKQNWQWTRKDEIWNKKSTQKLIGTNFEKDIYVSQDRKADLMPGLVF